ncbi:MAG: invasion associated locus B family protein [Hyphomicrobiales bacterium]|nr:invasion associated locus B family protein [Hyphomicrobiales bacterium]
MLGKMGMVESGKAFRAMRIVTVAAFGLSVVFASEGFAQAQKPAAPAPKGDAKPAAGAAPAAGAQEEKSSWVKLCEKAPSLVDENKDGKADGKEVEVCLTHHERIDGNTGLVLVSAALRQVKGQPKESLMIMVPLGMALPPGAQVKVDDKEPIKLAFTLCHQSGCTAEAEAPKEVVEQMKKGKQMVVAAINLAGQPVGFPVPLVGFGPAYDGQPVDNARYKEARQRLMAAIRERQIEMAKKAREEAAKKKIEEATKDPAAAAAGAKKP